MSYAFRTAKPQIDAATRLRSYMRSLIPEHIDLCDIPQHGSCNFWVHHDSGKIAFSVTIPSQWMPAIRAYFPKDEPPTNLTVVNFLLNIIEDLYLYKSKDATGQDWYVFDGDTHDLPDAAGGTAASLTS